VGADESLLTGWFEHEVVPLLDRHRSLLESSLRRKIANLCESVATALELRLGRPGKESGSHAGIDASAVRKPLDEADASLRHATERYQDWSQDRRTLWQDIADRAARAIVATPDGRPWSTIPSYERPGTWWHNEITWPRN
jgi:hypothetical protein